MEALCARADTVCEMRALSAALHSLHLYCATISAALICCCAREQPDWYVKHWRGQNIRGVASIVLGAAWCLGAAAATLRPADTMYLVSAMMPPLAWLAAAALHVVLWTRSSSAPILYLAIYWLLSAVSSAALLWQLIEKKPSPYHVEVYIHGVSFILAILIAVVDCVCFYDEVKPTKHQQNASSLPPNISYKHSNSHFYSKISFFWLNSLLYRGYESPLEADDLGELPDNERSKQYYNKFRDIYKKVKDTKTSKGSPSIWRCYISQVWPNFYIAGILKLFGDMVGLIPPLGLAVVIQFIEGSAESSSTSNSPPVVVDPVTAREFSFNGYVMLFIITLALITQAFLSQNSTHLVTVEGIRLKSALQGMVYDKCMRLAPWSAPESTMEEDTPLLHAPSENGVTQSGVLANLVSQDTYNIMSCVWICHYTWAIPLKVSVILYLLYTKLGISAIIGSLVSIILTTPLQFYIGKKISDNSKDTAKCTDHRVSKMTEILHGINVIKLYVWEDLFKEKILHLREVELKLLNKDSAYWSFLTFTTQLSTVLVTVITFIAYYFLESNKGLTAVNVFAALALFNQLTIPLLILPVTVLMVIQAAVSTKRIKDFLELSESNNVREEIAEERRKSDLFNEAFVDVTPEEDQDNQKEEADAGDQFSDDEMSCSLYRQEYIVRFRNAVFSWGIKNDALLEVDDLDIPAGKLIMVVGCNGSGKTSLLSAILGEMYLEHGDICFNGRCSTWFAGQPPWLLEGSVRDNIVMGSPWCQRRYARVLRATGLRPDLQLLPEGDATKLGSHGTPLSGGQRVRVCVARALYSNARLLALDEPLGALDAPLARHVVARGFVPAARAGRTVVIATTRLELLHYADLVIAVENGRITGVGRGGDEGLSRWAQLAAEARSMAARGGAGPPGGTARERSKLVRALSRAKFQRRGSDDAVVGIREPAGAHLLSEVPTCAGGSWRRRCVARTRPALSRQLSSPPPSLNNKWRREVRRAVSADASNTVLQREASLLRRLLPSRPHRTLRRWTPRTLRRLLNADSTDMPVGDNQINANADDSADSPYTSITSNGVDVTMSAVEHTSAIHKEESEAVVSECIIWWEYARACGWWGVAYCAAATVGQILALGADCWLTYITDELSRHPLTDEQMWWNVRTYTLWSASSVACGGAAVASCACAGAAARRTLHEGLLHAALHARANNVHMHRFTADTMVIDKKLPIAVSRWTQLALLCTAAMLVNVAASPWSLLALLPALLLYLMLQSVALTNAREIQRTEAVSASRVVSLASETCAGGGTVRAGRLQSRMHAVFFQRLDKNHNALLLLNATNRWLSLSLDLVGAGSVCISVATALYSGTRGSVAGLAGTYSLLLPAYLAHLAKCRADLDLQLAAVERVRADTKIQQEDYRDDYPIPPGWQRNGKIQFEDVSIQYEPGTPPILSNINLTIEPEDKVAICGRSGSGKSTLLLSCVGATTISSGRILVDGVDITKVPLRTLRHRIVMMPQEPIMFSGTLRENLDPLAVHTDEEIWHSLRAVGLHDFVSAQPAGLECSVGRGGSGWSDSRAARVCGARARLRAPHAAALLLDEPPDAPLDRMHVQAARLTATHRMSSVRGYERAIVLEDGRAVEFDDVRSLLAQNNSRLSRMLAATHAQ